MKNSLTNNSDISSTRFTQLRSYLDYYNKNIAYEGKLYKRDFLASMIEENNKLYKKPLQKFISSFVLNKTSKEIDELYISIARYCDLILHSDYLKNNEDKFSDKVISILENPYDYPIKDVLFTLLYNFLLLPPYTDQNTFNADMLARLKTLPNYLVKDFGDIPFYIKDIDINLLWKVLDDYFADDYEYANESFVFSLTDQDFLEKIALYTMIYNVDVVNQNNEIGFSLNYIFDENELDLYAEIEDFLLTYYEQVDKNIFRIASYPNFEILLKLSNPISLKNERTGKGGIVNFSVSIYAIPSKSSDQTPFEFIRNSLPLLSNFIPLFAKNFSYKNIYKKLEKDILALLEEESKIDLDEIEFYFGLKIRNDIERLIKEGDFDKIKEIISEEAKKKQKLTKSNPPLMLDFNKLISRLVESEQNTGNLSYNVVSKSSKSLSSSMEIIKTVDLSELAPKLFLSKELSNKILMIENYLKNISEYKKYMLKAPKGAIFYGPPGTGKTETVKHIAKATGLKVYVVDISDILNMYVGESEKRIKQMFQEYYKVLEKERAILFIDEADGFFGSRSSSNADLQNGVRSIALQELEGFAKNNLDNGFIILATNFAENLDKALKDRFSFFLKFNLPTNQERLEYFKYMQKYLEESKKIKFKNINWKEIVSATDNLSYRALYNMLNNAINEVLLVKGKIPPVIEQEDILSALKVVKEENIEKKVGLL